MLRILLLFSLATLPTEASSDREGEVASDCAGSGFDRICGTHHGPDRLYRVGAGDGHRDYGTTCQIVANIFEERALLVLGVVLFDGRTVGFHKFQSGNSKPSRFDAAGDLADKVSGNTAWFDQH